MRNAAGELHDLKAPTHFAASVRQNLAVLARDDGGKLIDVRLDQRFEAEHHSRTLYAKGLTWGFAHLSIESDRVTVKIVEVPTDGSGGSHVTFEQSFARRRHEAS